LADAYLLPTYTDQTVIANARALREEPLPDELIHRNDKFAHLITSLTSLDGDDAIGDGARIYGPSGAGKTTLARMAARKLEIEMMNVETTRVDCLSHSTMPAALHAVCRQLGIDGTFRYRLTPAGKYIDAIDDLDTPTVIIFDEADHLESLDVLHSLYEIPHVAVIIISNREEELLQRAESQTASRIRSGAWIQLDAYSDDELVDILERRVASALVENIVDDSALREMARRADGNAREAIWYLRFAVKHVVAGLADRVTVDVVDATACAARADLIQRVFSRLDREHRVICEILFEHGELRARDLHDRLENQAGESMSDKKRNRLLNKIRGGSGYDLVVRTGEGPATAYRLTDRTRELFEAGELP